jgi:hypothetical protein
MPGSIRKLWYGYGCQAEAEHKSVLISLKNHVVAAVLDVRQRPEAVVLQLEKPIRMMNGCAMRVGLMGWMRGSMEFIIAAVRPVVKVRHQGVNFRPADRCRTPKKQR